MRNSIRYWDKVISVGSMALVETSVPDILKQKLTIQNTKLDYNMPLYRKTENNNMLYIPRGIVRKPVDPIDWQAMNVKNKIELKPVQKDMVNNFIEYIENENPCGGILSAGTGVGKTVMGIWLACHFNLKTLVIVPTDRIFHQWVERIQTFTNCKEVGIVRGSICDCDYPFTVAMLHTICKDRFKNLEKEFGTVIYDEVHTISTLHFNTVAGRFYSKINIGLSATPRRKDGMENVFFYHIGEIAVLHKKVDAVPKVVIVKYYDPATYHGGFVWNGKLNIGRYFNRLATVENRNRTIAKYVSIAYKNNHNILVLTERLNHIEKIISKLLGLGIKPSDVGRLTSTIKEIDRRVIVGTYGSAGLGLDIPSLSCVVLAMPRTDVIQAVGRVTRAKDRTPIVIDIVDEASHLMGRWFDKRLKFYKKLTKDIVYV